MRPGVERTARKPAGRRRRLIIAAAFPFLAAAVLVPVLVSARGGRVSFDGPHQSAIAGPQRPYAFLAAFDVTARGRDGLRDMFLALTEQGRALVRGTAASDGGPESLPPGDTGETLGFRTAGLSLAFGVGPGLFDAKYGTEGMKPAALRELPAFQGDLLDAAWTGGDLVVLATADDLQAAYHAVHGLSRALKGYAVPRWVQQGFLPNGEANPRGTGRNLQGFRDGTVNPDVRDAKAMDRVVWIGDGEPGWTRGGTYMAMRRFRMLVEVWDRSSLADQERTIGRERDTGAPLGKDGEREDFDPTELPQDSHVALARENGGAGLLRRSYNFVDGLDPLTGQWDSGLVFLGFMKNPDTQFIPLQAALSRSDALNEYVKAEGSALFFMLPGSAPGSYVGAGLVPPPDESAVIETLQSGLGGLASALRTGRTAEIPGRLAAVTGPWETARRAGTFPDGFRKRFPRAPRPDPQGSSRRSLQH